MRKRLLHNFDLTTEANSENRDSEGRPLPKPPRVAAVAEKSAPRLAWERMLARGRKHASVASISSLLRFRRLNLPTPEITAFREPVKQFQGLGLTIQLAGLLIWSALWWSYDLTGAAIGAGICIACYLLGRARSKPWRCGNCRAPLTTAKVRVCPGCNARLLDPDAVKVMPRSRR